MADNAPKSTVVIAPGHATCFLCNKTNEQSKLTKFVCINRLILCDGETNANPHCYEKASPAILQTKTFKCKCGYTYYISETPPPQGSEENGSKYGCYRNTWFWFLKFLFYPEPTHKKYELKQQL